MYSIKGLKEHSAWLEKAKTTTFTLTRGTDVPVVDLGEGHTYLQQHNIDQEWGHCEHDGESRVQPDHAATPTNRATPSTPVKQARPRVSTTPLCSPSSKRPKMDLARMLVFTQPAAEPAADTRPLTDENAIGRDVLVPARVWPTYECDEQGGLGWTARIVSVSGGVAVIKFNTHTTARGNKYVPIRLQLSVLQPI